MRFDSVRHFLCIPIFLLHSSEYGTSSSIYFTRPEYFTVSNFNLGLLSFYFLIFLFCLILAFVVMVPIFGGLSLS